MNSFLLNKPYNVLENEKLASDFIYDHLKESTFSETFLLIMDHIKRFKIKNNEIDKLKKINGVLSYAIYTKDMLGQNRSSIVIKKLSYFNHTYEIRINQKYYKHRILFQFNSYITNDIESDKFFIMSYGFSKIEEGKDLTNELAKSNDKIKDDVILNNQVKHTMDKWLGGDWNELT